MERAHGPLGTYLHHSAQLGEPFVPGARPGGMYLTIGMHWLQELILVQKNQAGVAVAAI